jgi:hypothetical protein
MTVVAITRDLMDRSKITGAIDHVRVVGPAGDLAGATVVIVDLGLAGALEAAIASGAKVIAYGSHVDESTLAAARSAGAEAMPRSVFFRRLGEGTLL